MSISLFDTSIIVIHIDSRCQGVGRNRAVTTPATYTALVATTRNARPPARQPRGRPTLVTARLVLSPMSWDHLDDLCALDADPQVMHYLGPARTGDEVRALMPGRLSPTDDALGLGFWVGHSGSRFVGWWCLSLEGPHLAEVGWRLHQHAWGQGLAPEGARALIDHGFATVDLDLVIAETLSSNERSRAVMRKLGMRHTGTRLGEPRSQIPAAAASTVDEVTYEITKVEWTRLRQSIQPG